MNIEQPCELLETPNVKARTISSEASNEERSTTIRVDGVPSSDGKCRASKQDDDIVWSAEKPAAVYKITNIINNKIYIGYTTLSLARRMASHRFAAKQGSRSYLHTAMRKYGFENFIIELLYNCSSKQEAKQLEVKVISDCRQQNILNYNLLDGGNGGLYVKDVEAWKAKLRQSRKGKTPFKGCKHTNETKQKCALAASKRWDKRTSSNETS